MSDRTKKIFLLVSVIGSFAVYCVYYYIIIFHDAAYNTRDFKSFVIRYGARDSMLNYYNSATGESDFLTGQDSLKKTHLYLTRGEMDTLAQNAYDLGFRNFWENETTTDTTLPGYDKAPRYFLQFVYKKKTKTVTFDANFNGPIQLADANRILIKDIFRVLSEARERTKR
jgi:hypothetical protein